MRHESNHTPKSQSQKDWKKPARPSQNTGHEKRSPYREKPYSKKSSYSNTHDQTLARYNSMWRGTPSKNLLKKGFEVAGIELLPLQIEQIWKYHLCYREFNDSHDLSRLHSFQSICERHYIDVAILKKYLPTILPSPILDLGSGPGLPGIIIKILYPECEMILGEPRPARVEFLEHTIKQIGLKGISVFPHRVTPESFKIPINSCITRAFASIQNTFPHIQSALQDNGYLYFMKGPGLKQEMDEHHNHFEGYKIKKIHEYTLPNTSHHRSLAILQRTDKW